MASSVFTNEGMKTAVDRFFNNTPSYSPPTYFSVGQGTSAVTVADTDLESPIPISGTEQIDDCDATTGWTDSADMTVSLNTTIFKQGTGSLNLTKDGTGSANASTSKTTTSVNFTSKELQIWLYVADATVYAQLATSNCLTIRLGSDSSNYYQWTKNKANLAVGWNYISGLTSATASTTGSPVIASSDYTFVQMTATASGQVWTAGKIIMDDIKLASTDDYFKPYLTGPTVDEVNFEATYRSVLLVTQANGYSISEYGNKNMDSPKKLQTHATFTPIVKTPTTQIIIEEVIRFRRPSV